MQFYEAAATSVDLKKKTVRCRDESEVREEIRGASTRLSVRSFLPSFARSLVFVARVKHGGSTGVVV